MNIIFLESVHNFGGSSKSTLELAQRLLSVGHRVLIVDFWGCCESYVEDCNKKDIPLRIIDKRSTPILLREPSIIKTCSNYINYLRKIYEYKKTMKAIIKEFEPELISVNNLKTLSILSSSRNYQIGFFARGWFLPKSFNFFEQKLFKKRVDLFLTVSQSTRQMVYAGGFAKLSDVYVVPNGINFQDIQDYINSHQLLIPWYLDSDREFVMMHCGTFIETKGQHISVKVLRKLICNGVNVKLRLVGLIGPSDVSKNYFIYIKDLVREYGLEDNVEFVINENDILSYFSNSDMLIHPSYSEGLPRVVLESMAFGKPVVGNPVGGMIDFILNNYTGYLPNFNAIDEYVEIIQNLINNKERYKFISENASELIRSNYSESSQIQAFEKIS